MIRRKKSSLVNSVVTQGAIPGTRRGQHLFIDEMNDGTSAPPTDLQIIQSQEDWLIHQVVVTPGGVTRRSLDDLEK